MVGVSWGQPTEFKWKDAVIPADKVPEWASDFPLRMAYGNDDLYVEMTFLKTLEDHGLDASIRHDEPSRRRQDGGSPYGRAAGTRMAFSSFCAECVAYREKDDKIQAFILFRRSAI